TAIARDAFIHHFGGRTFVGSGIDHAGLMRRNAELYRRKWEGFSAPAENAAAAEDAPAAGPEGELPVPERVPAASDTSSSPASPPPSPQFDCAVAEGGGLLLVPRTEEENEGENQVPLSLCMIVRDNEGTIREC